MAGERQCHVSSAPIIASPTPFLGAGAVGLWAAAVVEEEARITFEGGEDSALRKNPGSADEVSGPIAAAFGVARVEQDEVVAGGWLAVITISRMEVTDVGARIVQRKRADFEVRIRRSEERRVGKE